MDKICYTCHRWALKRPGDYNVGNCHRTHIDTPPRHGCDFWIDHEGDISEAERIQRDIEKAEAEAKERRAMLRKTLFV